MRKITVGVMGSAAPEDGEKLETLAKELGQAIAANNCIVITGACNGVPMLVANAARAAGSFSIGVSPALNNDQHVNEFKMPTESSDVIIYSGFHYKGRNVLNIRSSDIVIFVSGSIGTLNEFTIAYDEGKIIGVLEGSGGITDNLKNIIEVSNKKTTGKVIYNSNPKELMENCISALN